MRRGCCGQAEEREERKVIFAPLPEVKAEGEEEGDNATEESKNGKTSVFQFPHLLLGVLALFLYVGVETLPMVSIIGYAKTVFASSDINLDNFSLSIPSID